MIHSQVTSGSNLLDRQLILVSVLLFAAMWFATPYRFELSLEPATITTSFDEMTDSSTRAIALPLAGGLCLGALVWNRRLRRVRLGKLTIFSLFYVLWAVASLLWSENLPLTAKRLIVFALMLVICMAFARILSITQIAWVLFICAGLTFLISLLAEVTLGTFHPFDPDYRFSGLLRPNAQGMSLALLIMTAQLLAGVDRAHRYWFLILSALAVPFLLLTKSRTATTTCLVICICSSLVRGRRRAMLVLALLAVTSLFLMVAVSSAGTADTIRSVVFLGRQNDSFDTMSNRGPLWEECSALLSRHPFMGFGYGAFWTADRVLMISSHQGWPVPNAHDMYLDSALELGIPAAALFMFIILGSLVYWISLYRNSKRQEYLYAGLMILWLSITMLDESVRLEPLQPPFLVYVFAISACFKTEMAARARAHLHSPKILSFRPRVTA